ncbi:CRISPR-associated endonuclease Cas3'' [Acidisoma sp.]|uniref:CRISPR-associated endonuclease Cas3'' n=1 Tax=Acidisoma sp. TaxID=1872115 RepID=UPI003AFFD207
MPYYAHTVDGRPQDVWEPLLHHLLEVAALSAANGARFGAGPLAHAAGLLHDLGKYSEAFQNRLHGSRASVDHSTAGAAWADQHLPLKLGRLIAHAIAGHHAGLQDDVVGRIEAKARLGASAADAGRADGLVLPDVIPAPVDMSFVKSHAGFQRAFLTRMIFSCLIDADRTAAAAFDARSGHREVPATAASPSIADLDDAMRAWIGRRQTTESALNRLRDEVLAAALAKAAEPPGAFTLTVPTGGGKTLTSLAFALAHARANDLDRVIVVIPYTSIIEQTAAVYRDVLRPFDDAAVLEHHSAFEREDEATWSRDHTGPDGLRLSMERWDKPIVVTTAVQFFESLFSDRPSRCRKLHSIARSVVVVDEAQTMPLPLLRPCVAALKELVRNYRCSVVLCTATQPALNAGPSGTKVGFLAGFTKVRELALDDVPRLFTDLRRVTLRHIGMQSDTDLAERFAASPQALCIVNQRAHARALFRVIRHLPGARHLSTCMHSVHRARVLAEIRIDLEHKRPCRVVSTSLVEAGVDIDFPLVLRAEAGLDQIAQAAGRCNREFRATPEESEVLVFQSPDYGVIQALKANAEAGREIMLDHPEDPFAPDIMKSFFELLYWRRGEAELDNGRVLEDCHDHAGDLNFPFEKIAKAMRFIDDTMVPVIVPVEDDGAVAGLLKELQWVKGVGRIARKLGRFTVGVPRKVRNRMLAQRVAARVRGEDFGDQFVVLLNLDLYLPASGLVWDDLTFMTTESLIIG